MENSTPIITIHNLFKRYGNGDWVLNGIDMTVYPGQVIGYIGPNGAGKSTTVKILTGLISEFEGDISILGLDLHKETLEIKKHIGYIPENAELYDVLTPMEYLQFIGGLYNLPENKVKERALIMLDSFGLRMHAHNRMDTFSKGMRQKVLIISGLIHNPKIIFMDEPLSGLDANAVIIVKEIISRLAAEGKTIFYCSHMMDVVEKVSDRIVLINNGRIMADGPFAELQQQAQGKSLENIFAQLTGHSDLDDIAGQFLNAFENE
ncbi:MAG: ABC transporter ATP-binding protein [Chitinophagaceae bacterium]|jgi:ABC-2 type transport system ATP-binding protein|nr:MAG: ABC transporter ATP-binding protein [Chitinophagaceae bacterium]